MRSSDFRRFGRRAALVAALALVGATVPRAVMAQGTGGSGDAGSTQSSSTNDEGHGKWGYLGLLGLAGLIPRGRKETVHHTDTTTRRP